MKTVKFPWNETLEIRNETSSDKKTEAEILDKVKKIIDQNKKAILFLSIFILILMISKPAENKKAIAQQETYSNYVDILLPMMPLPKKMKVEASIFKKAQVRKNSLTKSQLLSLVHEEDLIKNQHTLRLKKDLAPRKPLMWSDLEISSPNDESLLEKSSRKFKIYHPGKTSP